MLKHLRSHGLTALSITQCDVSQGREFFFEISPNHVVLASNLVRRKESSWFVYFNNLVYHNFETRRIQALELLNKPLSSAYLIFNKRWGKMVGKDWEENT